MDNDDENLLTPMLNHSYSNVGTKNKAGKNVNPLVHLGTMGTFCVVCEFKTTRRLITSHYVRKHPELEVYTSRLSPDYVEAALKEPALPEYESTAKGSRMKVMCYFCGYKRPFDSKYWTRHVLHHTGEYPIECQSCHQKDLHEQNHPASCLVYIPKLLFEYGFIDGYLYAFMCKSCNYVQTREQNMVSHLRNEHEYHDVDLHTYYHRIKLVSNRVCAPIANVKEEINETQEEDAPNASTSDASPVESADEMSTDSGAPTEASGQPISIKIKTEQSRCFDGGINIGYARLNRTEEILSSSICEQLAQEPDTVASQQPVKLSTADKIRIKSEHVDGIYASQFVSLVLHQIQ